MTCVGLEMCKNQKFEIYDKNIILVLLRKCLQFRNVRECSVFVARKIEICGDIVWTMSVYSGDILYMTYQHIVGSMW